MADICFERRLTYSEELIGQNALYLGQTVRITSLDSPPDEGAVIVMCSKTKLNLGSCPVNQLTNTPRGDSNKESDAIKMPANLVGQKFFWGGVKVTVTAVKYPPSAGSVTVTVLDTGQEMILSLDNLTLLDTCLCIRATHAKMADLAVQLAEISKELTRLIDSTGQKCDNCQ